MVIDQIILTFLNVYTIGDQCQKYVFLEKGSCLWMIVSFDSNERLYFMDKQFQVNRGKLDGLR